MVIDVKLVQLWNAYWPIDVTEDGMVIDVKLVQLSNAFEPIDITESGMVIDVKSVPTNAFEPIESCAFSPNVIDCKLV